MVKFYQLTGGLHTLKERRGQTEELSKEFTCDSKPLYVISKLNYLIDVFSGFPLISNSCPLNHYLVPLANVRVASVCVGLCFFYDKVQLFHIVDVDS